MLWWAVQVLVDVYTAGSTKWEAVELSSKAIVLSVFSAAKYDLAFGRIDAYPGILRPDKSVSILLAIQQPLYSGDTHSCANAAVVLLNIQFC